MKVISESIPESGEGGRSSVGLTWHLKWGNGFVKSLYVV